MNSTSPYAIGLEKTEANYTPLSPLSFIERTASVYPDHIAIIHGDIKRNWSETYKRCRQLASALTLRGISPGNTVAVMAANTPELFEAHYGVPMTGAVLNALNVRLDAPTIAFILDHGEAKVLLTDREFSATIREALKICKASPVVIDIDDPLYEGGELVGEIDYEAFISGGDPEFSWSLPGDEWDAISLNYTSGTTGDPKGVVYHHRGAYLNATSNIVGWNLAHHPVYLWTLPMFHCNGWCFPWSLAAVAGTSVCLRRVTAANIYNAIADQGVTHFCGAPIVLNFIVNAGEDEVRAFEHQVQVMTAAAPPPASVLEAMEDRGFRMTHVYGLTETYGPAVICSWHDEWDSLPSREKAAKKARQGVRYHMLQGLTVMDPDNMTEVPKDGETMGEVMFRGNVVMKGYLKNPSTTQASLSGGWFHSGDLGVMHPDGYIELKDRSKDIIISGGENISSIEVESVLYRHPAVLEAAVVAKQDDKWGETPCAFIELKKSAGNVTTAEIIAYCRENMAHYKAPKTVIFGPLPKTSTGKVQKYVLRKTADAV